MKSFTPLFTFCTLILIISFHVKEVSCRLDSLVSSHMSGVQFNGEVIIALRGDIVFDKQFGDAMNIENDSMVITKYNQRVREYVQKEFCILVLGDLVFYPEEINITNRIFDYRQNALVEDESYASQL